ncbi:MAG: IPT/TIG domain-containing protein [Bacteriovoracaceae bacterium]
MKYLAFILFLSSCVGVEKTYVQKIKEIPPIITSISPSIGPNTGGTNITLVGTGFKTTTTVTIGGSSCSVLTYISPTQLVCLTPPHALGYVSVSSISKDGQVKTVTDAFRYITNAAGTPGFAILSGGSARFDSASFSGDVSVGDVIFGQSMISTTLQLKVNVQGILFDPNL